VLNKTLTSGKPVPVPGIEPGTGGFRRLKEEKAGFDIENAILNLR
jgi:hypothetical protein